MSKENDHGITPAALIAALNGDLENAIAALTPGGIEAQEAQGQKDFVVAETLPRLCPRTQLEQLGFVFGEDADDTFVYVTFPKGWKKLPTDHSMWSDLIDDKGRKRGAIFFKAAFYDRRADMHLTNRFSYGRFYEHHDEYIDNVIQYYVMDCDKIVFKTLPLSCEKQYSEEWWEKDKTCSEWAQNWLNEEYPNWEDPMAYWED